MTEIEIVRSASCYLEFGADSLHVVHGQAGLDLPIDRGTDGSLTPACFEQLGARLQRFLQRKFWEPRLRVFCALGSRGVALRRLSLPASTREELPRLLQLQVESLFPLPPDDLAWGYLKAGEPRSGPAGSPAQQEILVAAVKKDALEDYSKLLASCNVTPVFTLAALARACLCPQPLGPYAALNLARYSTELATFDRGLPVALRVLPWGSQTLVPTPGTGPPPRGTPPAADAESSDAALDSLRHALDARAAPRIVFITGGDAAQREKVSQFVRGVGSAIECKTIDVPAGPGVSAATLGLKQAAEKDHGWSPLVLQVAHTNGNGRPVRRAPIKWAALAVCLALVSLGLPNIEAMFLKTHLTRRLTSMKADKGRLATIDRELEFLRYLKQNQPPYLDALFILARSAPPGAQLNSISFNRRGDVALRGSMQNPQIVADFRSKLIDSGLFSAVAVEEQTPTPDRQKVNVRIGAQWKPAFAHEAAAHAAVAREPDKDKAPGGPMPPGAPSNLPMPGTAVLPGTPTIQPPQGSPVDGSHPPRTPALAPPPPQPLSLPKESKE
jgi:hypothetical protein